MPTANTVVEIADASNPRQARAIVTHNLRDFGPAAHLGLQILAPGAFLKQVLRS